MDVRLILPIFPKLLSQFVQAFWLFLRVLEDLDSSGRPVGFISITPGTWRTPYGAKLWPNTPLNIPKHLQKSGPKIWSKKLCFFNL